jgi:hypothetical protein
MRDIIKPAPATLCTAPPDIVMSDAERMLTSSAVASEADITAAWLTSSAVIWIGLVLSPLQAARMNASIGAPTMSERFIRIASFGWEGTAGSRVCDDRVFSAAHRPFDVPDVLVVT